VVAHASASGGDNQINVGAVDRREHRGRIVTHAAKVNGFGSKGRHCGAQIGAIGVVNLATSKRRTWRNELIARHKEANAWSRGHFKGRKARRCGSSKVARAQLRASSDDKVARSEVLPRSADVRAKARRCHEQREIAVANDHLLRDHGVGALG